MQSIIIITAILASVAAAPVYLLEEETHEYHAVPLTSKSTFTQSSQVVDHGSTLVHPSVIPVAHAKSTITKSNQVISPVYAYHSMPVHGVYHIPSKTTETSSSQHVNHGGTAIVHAPIVHMPVVHTPVVYHASPLVAVNAGASAITHHSSTVHETVPLVAVHH